ncbi:carbon-nitrogen hydrolase family protein [Fusobacterium sp.]|uniref:carbon-nitrogen hydrolase family protein n=1 Tax=Fusobacterium sp. TaxID=68766 RepID=UPI0026118D36|nr:carbon-nitrogen hydrolase family protein [Fusobacterium sp.]
MKVCLLQSKVYEEKEITFKNIMDKLEKIKDEKIDILVLPEMFNCPYKTSNFPIYAEEENGKTYNFLSSISKKLNCYVVGGSIPEKDVENRIYNTTFIFDRKGNQIGKHRKVHLFDIEVEGGQSFKESETLTSGNKITTFESEYGIIGVAICYDFRFPEISRIMVDKGAKIIIVPAAFNMTTGPAHWEILFRTRAMDNQVYTIGVSPARDLTSCYTSYGNSLIVSPWGDVIRRLDEKESVIVEELNLEKVDKVRNELPLLKHRRKDVYDLK